MKGKKANFDVVSETLLIIDGNEQQANGLSQSLRVFSHIPRMKIGHT